MARKDAKHSGVMGNDAERLRARMDRLGYTDVQLARESGVDRGTIAAIKRGQGFRRSSLAKIEKTLDALEHEAGFDAPPAEEHVEFEVQIPGDVNATVVVRGPGAEQAVARLLRRIQSENRT